MGAIPTLTLGLILAFGFSGLMPISDMPRLVDLHLSWGLLGWVGMVLFAVVFRLVPIFYVTQEFPPWLRTLALPAVFVLLLVLSFSRLLNGGQLDFSLLLIVLIFSLSAVMVFRVLHRRKRRIVDASMLFIWTGMASLPVSAVVWATSDNEIVLGLLLLGGVCLNMPIGLIYKVIPFLCWFHLQGLLIRREKLSHELPSMKHYITEKSAKGHYYLHLAALLFLLAASEYPHSLGRLSGTLLTLSSLFFFRNILHALRAFRKLQSTLSA